MPYYLKTFIKQFFTYSAKATFTFLLFILFLAIGFSLFFSQQRALDDTRTFSIDGTAEREITPDTAYITIGTMSEGSDFVKLQNEANKKINNTVQKIKDLGIPPENIKTNTYDVSPNYDYSTNKMDGYRINVEIAIKIENTSSESSKPGEVIKAGADAGLNEVRNLNFGIENREEILEELKLEAIDDAKSKKDTLAERSGLRLGELKNISDGGYYPYPTYEKSMAFDEMPGGAMEDTISEPINVEPGQTELSASVTLYYEIL